MARQGEHLKRVRSVLLVSVVIIGLGLLLTCCPANRDGMPGQLARAMEEATSAARSGVLALDLWMHGRSTVQPASVQFTDARDDVTKAGVDMDQDIPEGSEAPRATALLSGQVLATRIFGGAPPRSHLQEIPWKLVDSVGITVKLKPNDMRFDVTWVELWLRDRIIKRIPGGCHATE